MSKLYEEEKIEWQIVSLPTSSYPALSDGGRWSLLELTEDPSFFLTWMPLASC